MAQFPFFNRPLAALGLLASACNSPRLPEGTASIDLASAGLTATLTGPKGSTVTRGALGDRVEITWGDLGTAGQVVVSPTRTSTLDCPSLDKDCKVVELKMRGVLYSTKAHGKPIHEVVVHFVFGDKTEAECKAEARTLEDARRLFEACQTVSGSGAKSPKVSATTLSSAPVTVLELQDVTVAEKAGAAGLVKWSIRAPKGWSAQAMVPGGRMFVDPTANTAPLDAITIRVSPYPTVKTLAQAEVEAKRNDAAGLDTIDERKALNPKSFLLSTAPRGKAQIEIVHVFASGKKQSMWAQCYGPAKRKAIMDEICGSLAVE